MKIAFLGDIALTGQFDLTQTRDAKERVRVLKDKLKGYDFVVANLESPLTNKTHSLVCKSMHLRSAVKNVEILQYLGINAVTLANNHIMDFGRQGLIDTTRTLDEAGIRWYGVDGKYLDTVINGERITLSGFCCYSANGVHYIESANDKGVNLLKMNLLLSQLERDEQEKSFSIVSLHYGIEHTNFPSYKHVGLIEELSNYKPIIIHGHHPHQIQGISRNNDSLIAYSLGNALFDDTVSLNKSFSVKMNDNNRKSFILGVEVLNGKIISYITDGFYIGKDGITDYPIEEEIRNISNVLDNISFVTDYESIRREQYRKAVTEKFGKHDLKWLISRLNYYSVGAKLDSRHNRKKYKKEVETWPDPVRNVQKKSDYNKTGTDVCVVMSTYNGEKYLKEQIQSILNQVGVKVTLLIRDDGSKDRTVDIIKSFETDKIILIEGSNRGSKDSFLDALAFAPDVQYYAFADQDDVWDENKLIRAVNMLEEVSHDKVALYCGRTRLVDKNLKEIPRVLNPLPNKKPFLRGEAIQTTGCTMVFNARLKNLVSQYHPRVFAMHDAWLRDVCLAINGEIIYDNQPCICYRQHENNVVGGKRGRLASAKRLLSFYIKMGKCYHTRMLEEIYNNYKEMMPAENVDRYKFVTDYNKNLKNRMKLLLDKDFYRGSMKYKIETTFLVLFSLY